MLEFGTCPRCHMEIAEERNRMQPMVCNHCGFTHGRQQDVEAEIEKSNIKWFVRIAVLVLATYIQLNHWDKHALNIIPIAAKQNLGLGSTQDAERKAEICMDLRKWDCVEASYEEVAKTQPELWQRAGDFQMKRAKYNQAAQSYYKFFQNGGDNLEVSYKYAMALAQLGEVDEAVKYFDQVLAARPDTLQISVVQNYVKLLVKHQRYNQAKVLIAKVRKKAGPTAESFMEPEFAEINQHLTTASR